MSIPSILLGTTLTVERLRGKSRTGEVYTDPQRVKAALISHDDDLIDDRPSRTAVWQAPIGAVGVGDRIVWQGRTWRATGVEHVTPLPGRLAAYIVVTAGRWER